MRICRFAAAFALSASLFGCSSNSFFIPGEQELIWKNITTEYYNIGEGYFALKNYSKAIEYYALSLQNEELHNSASYKIARCYALEKEWSSALSCYEELLSHDSENLSLQMSVAYITAMSGNVDDAALLYERLIGEHPFEPSLQENYIELLIFIGRGEDAEKRLISFQEQFPDNEKIPTLAREIAKIVDNPTVTP